MQATEIPIESPCGADWRTMKPSDKKRFCESCRKHVHDLSAMTSKDARELLASPPTEGLCVRYLYDAHGEIVFRDAPLASSMLVRAKRIAARAAAVAFPVALAACSSAMGERQEPMMMGAVACPLPPPPPIPSASASAVVQVMGTPPILGPESK